MEYAAQIFDQVQRLYGSNGFNDHELHCVLKFEHGPDAEILKNAVLCSMAAIPILGTRYVNAARPRWTSLAPAELSRAFVIAATDLELEAFLVAGVDETVGPQVRVCLLATTPFTVAFKLNHMICDAAGFKQYLHFLCKVYSGLEIDPAYRPPAITGDRSMRGVLNNVDMRAKLKALFFQRGDTNRSGDHEFPLTRGRENRPFILTRKLGRNRVTALNDYCGDQGATLNDAVLTGYYRCLFQQLKLRPGAELQIPITVDMRRYLTASDEFTSPTNLSSMLVTRLEHRPNERFEASLGRIKAIMDAKKSADIGLNAFITLDLLYRIFGGTIANRLLNSGLKNPLIWMTNVGKLDPDRISFANLRPRDAYLCGSIKHKPSFQLAISTYDGELTLSVNLYGSTTDRQSISSFLDMIEAELPGGIGASPSNGV